MNVVEFWFRTTVLLRLISVSFGAHLPIHSQIMRAVRTGNAEQLEQAVERQPECLKKFKVEYWSMALRVWGMSPDSEDKKRIVRILVDELEDINEKWEDMTPLICAVLYGHRKALNLILRVANINERNSKGMTALMIAIKFGLLKMAEELIDHGADTNNYDEKKRSAIHYACKLRNQNKREKAIWMLLGNHAEVSLMKCPYALKTDRIDVYKVLTNDPVEAMEMNADELIARRLKMELEEFGMTIASTMMLIAVVSASKQLITDS